MILDGLSCDAIRMGVPDTGSLTLTEMADCAGRIRAYWPVMRSVIFPLREGAFCETGIPPGQPALELATGLYWEPLTGLPGRCRPYRRTAACGMSHSSIPIISSRHEDGVGCA